MVYLHFLVLFILLGHFYFQVQDRLLFSGEGGMEPWIRGDVLSNFYKYNWTQFLDLLQPYLFWFIIQKTYFTKNWIDFANKLLKPTDVVYLSFDVWHCHFFFCLFGCFFLFWIDLTAWSNLQVKVVRELKTILVPREKKWINFKFK